MRKILLVSTVLVAGSLSAAQAQTAVAGKLVREGKADVLLELPRVYRRVKLSEDDPYGREEDIALFA